YYNQLPRTPAEVAGDGVADISGIGSASVWVSTAAGSGHFTDPLLALSAFGSANSWTSENQYPRALGDVNGDGKADIIGFGDAGVWQALATAGGNFAAPSLVLNAFGASESWTSQDKYPRFLADVNGDGKADIIGFGDGGVWEALATSNGNFAAPTLVLNAFGVNQTWTSQNTYPRMLADVSGDGMADIVGLGDAGGYVSL